MTPNIFGHVYSTNFPVMGEMQLLQDCIPTTRCQIFQYESIACNQIIFYWFSELDERLMLREKRFRKMGLLFSMCWFEWPDSNHAQTDSGRTQLWSWARVQSDIGVFQRRHLQPTACHFHVAEAEVRVNLLQWVRSRRDFIWLRRSCSQCWENTCTLYWFGPGSSCCGCLLALDFAFVQRRHLPSPDCQLTEQIP